MTEIKKLPQRSEVPLELTWDLSKVYSNVKAWNDDAAILITKVQQFNTYKGTLKQGAVHFLNVLQQYLSINRKLEKLVVFAEMKNDEDTTNAISQELNNQADTLTTQVSKQIAWFEPELVHLSDELLMSFSEEEPKLQEYRHLLADIRSQKAHLLNDEEETLLAGANSIFDTPEKTFEALSDADMKFPVIEGENHQAIQLSEGIYSKLLESKNRAVRQRAFKGLYQTYGKFKNTFATTLTAQVKVQNYEANIRKYKSAKDAALAQNHIPDKVYDTLITSVHDHLPLLHRYVKLRKKLLKVSELHMYDLYTPLVSKVPLNFTYEEAKKKILEVLKVFGSEYLAHVKEALNDRWIDVVENKGKRSGAYSSGTYDTLPYILLNWQDGIENLFTLIHEMGHSMHSYFTTHNQPYQYGDYPIFIAEIASTTNENLLTDYLLQNETDPHVQAYVLNHYLDGFKGSVFRQTQFAEFEEWIHTQDAEGKPLTAVNISDYYGKLNQEYYGPTIFDDPEIHMEWMRIPHFYYDFYVYQYATGFAAATTLATRIEDNDKAHTTAYLNYLKAGSSDYPVNVMQKAGVDMTNSTYLDKAFTIFEHRVDQLENLLIIK